MASSLRGAEKGEASSGSFGRSKQASGPYTADVGRVGVEEDRLTSKHRTAVGAICKRIGLS